MYVRDGAQLKPTFSSAQGDSYISPPVHIIGEGPDGNGAICAANGGMGDNMFSKGVILDGPATVGGTTRIGFYLYMNGYTLTDKVSAEHLVRGVSATAPGNIVYSGGYRFVVSGTFNGSSANTLTIAKAGGTVCFWNTAANTPWTLLVNENASIASGAGTDKSRNRWHGPVVIADGKTLSLTHYSSPAAGVAVGVSGPISGNGNLVVTASSYSGLKAYLSGVNTYTGGTTVKNNGTLYAEKDKSIPETGAITLSGGYMNFVADANAWTMTELAKRLANVTGTSGNAVIYTSSGQSATDDVGFTVTSGEGSLIGHGGDGSLVTTGPIAGKPKLYNASGTWTVQSPTLDIHGFNVTAGTLALDGAGYAWTSNYASYVGGDATRIGTLVVKDSVVDGKLSLSGSSPGAYTHLGHSVAGARGLLKVEDGGAFTNKLFIGHNAKMCGAVYQTGGNVLMSCNSTADGMWGSGGYGFYDAAGGELGIGHCLNIGGNGTSGTGILRVSGGSAIARGDMFVCSGATGVVHVTGGRLEVTQWLRLGQKEWAEGSARGTGILTIDGPDAVVKVGNVLSLGQRLSPAIGILNINGGALEVVNPIQNSPNNGATTFYTDASQKEGYVNFNGGTLRSMLVDLYLFGTGALTKPTKVTVFAGGAVIDANGHNSFVSAPLEAPSGWGVASIALPQDLDRLAGAAARLDPWRIRTRRHGDHRLRRDVRHDQPHHRHVAGPGLRGRRHACRQHPQQPLHLKSCLHGHAGAARLGRTHGHEQRGDRRHDNAERRQHLHGRDRGRGRHAEDRRGERHRGLARRAGGAGRDAEPEQPGRPLGGFARRRRHGGERQRDGGDALLPRRHGDERHAHAHGTPDARRERAGGRDGRGRLLPAEEPHLAERRRRHRRNRRRTRRFRRNRASSAVECGEGRQHVAAFLFPRHADSHPLARPFAPLTELIRSSSRCETHWIA